MAIAVGRSSGASSGSQVMHQLQNRKAGSTARPKVTVSTTKMEATVHATLQV